MKRVILDASVAVKWCLVDEVLTSEAEQLLDTYRRQEVQLLVPDLFWPELANALWKAVWKGKIDAGWADKALTEVRDLGIPTVASFDSVPSAMRLAVSHGRTVYDALYVALALRLHAELITADERLANALAARFPVKWLGAL